MAHGSGSPTCSDTHVNDYVVTTDSTVRFETPL